MHQTRLVTLGTFLLTLCSETVFTYPDGQCETINIQWCNHLQYTMTSMPNLLGHQSQAEARAELTQYTGVVGFLDCSTHLKFLLCSVFVPMCTDQLDGPLVIQPCRSMCQQVKADCEPKLAELNENIVWPLDCSKLPEHSPGQKEQLCMAPDDVRYRVNNTNRNTITIRSQSPITLSYTDPTPVDLTNVCPKNFHHYENHTCTDLCDSRCKDCTPRCEDVYFTAAHKQFTFVWIAIWSSLSVISTLVTLGVFCVEPSRFKYPTRPIMFMAFCYFMYSLAYVVRLIIPANDIICRNETENLSLLITNGIESTLCIIVFLIQYYFNVASSIWWLVLCLTWYLAAGRKWSLEALNSIACYFHIFAWAIPAILTIAILITGKVDGNELTGMCYVGNNDRWSLLFYVITPSCLPLIIGEVFLLCGFSSLIKIRTNLKSQANMSNIRKLEKLMAKIGVFAILYTVPSVCVLGANIHELVNIEAWTCMASKVTGTLSDSIPTVEIHMLKIFMSLIVGITISMWVLSSKTLESCHKRCNSKQQQTSLRYPSSQLKNKPYMFSASTVPTSEHEQCLPQHYQYPIHQQSHHPSPAVSRNVHNVHL